MMCNGIVDRAPTDGSGSIGRAADDSPPLISIPRIGRGDSSSRTNLERDLSFARVQRKTKRTNDDNNDNNNGNDSSLSLSLSFSSTVSLIRICGDY